MHQNEDDASADRRSVHHRYRYRKWAHGSPTATRMTRGHGWSMARSIDATTIDHLTQGVCFSPVADVVWPVFSGRYARVPDVSEIISSFSIIPRDHRFLFSTSEDNIRSYYLLDADSISLYFHIVFRWTRHRIANAIYLINIHEVRKRVVMFLYL